MTLCQPRLVGRGQRCGSRVQLQVHHVGPVTTTAIDDQVTLCRRCHQAAHSPAQGTANASKPGT